MTQLIGISGPLLTLKQRENIGPYEVIIDFEATNDPDTLEKLKELGMSGGRGSYDMSDGILEITIPTTKYGDMFFYAVLDEDRRIGFVSYGVTIDMDTGGSKVDGHLTISTSDLCHEGGYGDPQTITFSSVEMDFKIYN
ncbi:hypothetical protein B7O87_04215 [Cylindrospermopsis raciborskii CENA303]|uniref:Uncharacterized protein n=1 Tax=Cylindrospermopsis raciborskii CENA303 TaxID=1170769 RepID=A0A1X4GA63_9CYAN|nr:hypothetical protein [Cylindrospermopsis raciborskii]OSO94032.1 hypothetical protein B7O87_04215 [Cylindrospermopsis raciborskii CENA303]